MENRFNNLYSGVNDVKAIATIVSERKDTKYKASYTIEIESINQISKFEGTKLILYINKNQKLEFGDKVFVYGTFETANAATNYKAFDYRE